MFEDPNGYEFAPSDIGEFVKWFGWATPPYHFNNDASLRERETWYWVSASAIDALEDSSWDQGHDDSAPILLPEDLPSLDGIMVLANPLGAPSVHSSDEGGRRRSRFGPNAALQALIALRWTTTSDSLLMQAAYGSSALDVMEIGRADPALNDLAFNPPPGATLRPDTWKHRQSRGDDEYGGLRAAPRRCSDGSPLWLVFAGPVVWQWARRSTCLDDADMPAVEDDPGPAATERLFGLPTAAGHYAEPLSPEAITIPTQTDLRRLVAMDMLPCRDSDAVVARVAHCLWAFASKPLPPTTPRRVMRDIPKQRRGGGEGGLRVVVLREESEGVQTSGQQGRKRPRRHLVRGHWRQQWYPSIEGHRTKWIAPHLRAGRPADPPVSSDTRMVRNIQVPQEEED